MKRSQFLVALAMSVMDPTGSQLHAADDVIRSAVTLYASIDSEVKGDFGGGSLKPSTRFDHPTVQGQFVFEPVFDSNVFPIAMNWDLDKARIYVAVSYIGLLDELALFNRPLAAPEINRLRKQPGLLSPLKNR